MNKGVMFIVLIFILILLAGLFFFTKSNQISKDSDGVEDNSINNQEDGIGNSRTNNNVDNTQTETEVGDTGGGGGEEANREPPSELDCPTIQITYSMINLNKTSVCNQNQSGICINKTVNCYIEIHNRETQGGGFFKVELRFLEEGKNKEDALKVKTSRFFLDAQQQEIFEEIITVQSFGEDGVANKKINCFFNTLEVPVKCA